MAQRILCVHGSGAVLRDLRGKLEQAGYEVLVAKTGEEALNILDHVPVDGAVLSFHMEAPQGRSLRNMVRRCYPEMPVLLFSDVDEVRNMPLHVFSEYLQHPASPAEVLTAIGV